MPVLRVRRGERAEELHFNGPAALDAVLAAHGYALPHPCGGHGACGKCAVVLRGAVSPANAAERRAGARLSCQAILLGDCEAELPPARAMEQIAGDEEQAVRAAPDALPGAAIDIGTTTIVLRLYDLRAQTALSSAAMLNPQTAIAADVMGRIGAAMAGQAALLQGQVTQAVRALLARACRASGVEQAQVHRAVITGNTAMLYLLCGRDPRALSRAPFLAEELFDRRAAVAGLDAYLPPCMHAFVGADITCAALDSGMCGRREAALLCDIGTNGEMALWKDGRLFVASTAAGPAFEGAGITQGCGSVRGAIDRVWLENGALRTHAIGDAPTMGLCGSGLVDALAALRALGQIDETGAMEKERLPLAEGVWLYQSDIRSVQLAKAAIAAGMETLLRAAGTDAQAVEKLYIAGGFGNHLNMRSAAAIGLIPPELAGKAVFIGNGALTGAAGLLLHPERASEARALAGGALHVQLGGNPAFNQAYIENMLFPY